MKCQNCGNHEANYHYTSNINGNVTEKHLCGECAGKLGVEEDLFSYTDRMFSSMFSDFFGRRSAFPGWGGLRLAMPTMVLPRIEIRLESDSGEKTATEPAVEADPELQKRREINMLRQQMREAANKEEFEKAAEFRDKLKALESPEG